MSSPKPTTSAAPIASDSLGEPPRPEVDWVTVGTFENAPQAELVRARLEASGIESRLTDQHTIGSIPTLHLALGGVGIQVPSPDEPRARSVMNTLQQPTSTHVFRVKQRATFSTLLWALPFGLGASFICSRYFHRFNLGFLLVLLSVISGAILGWFRVFYQCSELRCGARLDPGMTRCPKCGGQIQGEIASLDERLEAEEKLRKRTS